MAIADFAAGMDDALRHMVAERIQREQQRKHEERQAALLNIQQENAARQGRLTDAQIGQIAAETEAQRRQRELLDSLVSGASDSSLPGTPLAGGGMTAAGVPAEGPAPGAALDLEALSRPGGRLRLRAAGVDPNAIFGAVPTPRARQYTPKDVRVGGRDVLANFDPATGQYFDPDTGNALRGVQPIPPGERGVLRTRGADDPTLPRGAQQYIVSLTTKYPGDYRRALTDLNNRISEWVGSGTHPSISAVKAADALRRAFGGPSNMGEATPLDDDGGGIFGEAAAAPAAPVSGGRLRTSTPTGAPPGAPNTLTRAQLAQVARDLGISEAEAEAQVRARGYVVQ